MKKTIDIGKISVTEFRKLLPKMFKEVEKGSRFLITENGEPDVKFLPISNKTKK